MSGDVVILGDMVLDAVSRPFGTPSEVSGGIEQQLGVSQLIGGARNVDAMGQAPLPIKWQGRWRGPSATSDHNTMLAMTQAGLSVPCTWNEYYYTVLIKNYSFKYQASFEILYTVELTVIPDDSILPGLTLDDIVNGDMAVASGVGAWQ
ncbi:MAG: hypothetical protein JO278_15760 [Dyella sp.]|nr:hypothetical protein [Dyella sp.]